MSAPMREPPRYVPARALPAYAHVPGQTPRPAPQPGLDAPGWPGWPGSIDDAPGDWRQHPAFLWGLDLYNHGFPWEAHEVWEALWTHAPRGSVVRDMLQALIQCAAAVVQARAGRAAGQARLATRALGRLDAVRARAGSRCLGIDIDALAQVLRAYGQGNRAAPWPLLVLAPGA